MKPDAAQRCSTVFSRRYNALQIYTPRPMYLPNSYNPSCFRLDRLKKFLSSFINKDLHIPLMSKREQKYFEFDIASLSRPIVTESGQANSTAILNLPLPYGFGTNSDAAMVSRIQPCRLRWQSIGCGAYTAPRDASSSTAFSLVLLINIPYD